METPDLKNIYTVSYFIKKFEAIPEWLWLIGSQGEIENKGEYPHCALGWCRNKYGNYGYTDVQNNGDPLSEETEGSSLAKLFYNHGIYFEGRDAHGVAFVNNGEHPKYQQPTPKQRILAALYDIKRIQEPKQPEVIYKIVEVDRKVKELVKEERILN